MAAGATQAQVDALRSLQQQIAEVTDAEKAREEVDKAAQDAIRNQHRLHEQGADRIASIKDEIDLLTGAATKADIAMRQMTREGFTQEQIDEVGRLTEELDRLEKEKNKKSEKDRPQTLQAALRGSAEAASIMLRGVGQNKTEQQLAKLVSIQQQALNVAKDNKPSAIHPLTLGT
jgi:hypothetical protein